MSTVIANNNDESWSCREVSELQHETANVTEEFSDGIHEDNRRITGDTKDYVIKRKEFGSLNKMSSIIVPNDMASNNTKS